MKIKLLILSSVFFYQAKFSAAVFNIPNGDVSALITAITIANNNGEADIINLAVYGTYLLTTINYTSTNPGTSGAEGQRGLPRILL